MEDLCQRIDERIMNLKNHSYELAFFLNVLKEYNPIIIGGFIRNTLNNKEIRDLDLILNCPENGIIEMIIKKYRLPYSKNQLNGYKIKINDLTVDIWYIGTHYLVKDGLYAPDVANLPEMTLINYDSLIYDMNNHQLFMDYYLEATSNNEIDFVGKKEVREHNPNKYLSIVRIMKMCLENKMNVSQEVYDYILNTLQNDNQYLLKLKRAYYLHYQKEMPYALENYINQFTSLNKPRVLKKQR